MSSIMWFESYGFNDNIDEYGEGGNSLIKKMNDLNKKEYQTVKVQKKKSGDIKIDEKYMVSTARIKDEFN